MRGSKNKDLSTMHRQILLNYLSLVTCIIHFKYHTTFLSVHLALVWCRDLKKQLIKNRCITELVLGIMVIWKRCNKL